MRTTQAFASDIGVSRYFRSSLCSIPICSSSRERHFGADRTMRPPPWETARADRLFRSVPARKRAEVRRVLRSARRSSGGIRGRDQRADEAEEASRVAGNVRVGGRPILVGSGRLVGTAGPAADMRGVERERFALLHLPDRALLHVLGQVARLAPESPLQMPMPLQYGEFGVKHPF
jgi:hypothetical protein